MQPRAHDSQAPRLPGPGPGPKLSLPLCWLRALPPGLSCLEKEKQNSTPEAGLLGVGGIGPTSILHPDPEANSLSRP